MPNCATQVSIPIWFDLKSSLFGYGSLCESSFNSYMVRFKARLRTKGTTGESCFNSYMVRFKERLQYPTT